MNDKKISPAGFPESRFPETRLLFFDLTYFVKFNFYIEELLNLLHSKMDCFFEGRFTGNYRFRILFVTFTKCV